MVQFPQAMHLLPTSCQTSESKDLPKVPVLVSSNLSSVKKISDVMAMGAVGYVLKPFDFLYLELVVLSKLAILKN